MAHTTTNDLLTAIDLYMKTGGRGANYIASKMLEIFDDKGAPLNPKSGPLSLINEMVSDLQIALGELYVLPSSPIPTLKKTLTWVNRSFKTFNKKINDLVISMDTFDNYINNLVTVGTKRTKVNTPYRTSQTGFLKVTLQNFNQAWINTGIPVYIRDISNDVIRKMGQGMPEKVIRSTPTAAAPIPVITKSQPNVLVNHQHNESGGGGMISSIIGFLASSAALIGGLGYMAKELDKTPAGREMKERIKKMLGDSISSIFTKIGDFMTAIPKTLASADVDGAQGIMGRGLSILISGLKFVVGEFYDKVVLRLILDGKASIAKAVSAIGISFSKKIFNKLTFGIFNISSHIKWLERFVSATAGMAAGAASKTPGGILNSLKGIMIRIAPKLLKVLRFIPGLGLILSLGFAGQRIASGDIVGGLLELAAGIAYQFAPTGIGLALGIGIDAFNAFLDYKQEQTPNRGKGAIISDMLGVARTWIENKLGINLRNIPILGGMIRFGEAIGKISNDPLEGMKLILESLWFMSPMSALNGAWSFIEFIQSTQTVQAAGASIKSKIAGWFNPSSVIDQVTSWTKNLYNSAMSIFDTTPEVKSSDIRRGGIIGPNISNITTKAVQDATIIQPDSKDQILMAKSGGPFDLAMKQMNRMMNEKLDELINVATANVQATISGSKAVAQTVAATAGSRTGQGAPQMFNGSDPIRTMRNQVGNFVQ